MVLTSGSSDVEPMCGVRISYFISVICYRIIEKWRMMAYGVIKEGRRCKGDP